MVTKEATLQQVTESLAPAAEVVPMPNGSVFTGAQFRTIDTALRSIFPTQQEETKAQRARAILQEVATNLSDQQLEIFLTELQCLIDSWFDVYEQDIFSGLTLKEVMKGG